MKVTVTIFVLLLSVIAGLMTIIKLNMEKETFEIKTENFTVSVLTAMLRKIQASDWILLSMAVLPLVLLAYSLSSLEMDYLQQVRFLTMGIVLLPIMIIDWHTHRIPNRFIVVIFGIGGCLLLAEFLVYPENFLYELVKSIAGCFICLVLFYLLSRLTRDGIGMGDVKLIMAMGWILGLSTTIMAVMFALIVCSIISIVLLLGKKKNKNDHIAFGPFLFFGYICALLLFVL